MLKMKMDGTSKIELTAMALPVIKGEEEVWLREDYRKTSLKSAPKKKARIKKSRKSKPKYTTRKANLNFTSAGEEEVFGVPSASLFELTLEIV